MIRPADPDAAVRDLLRQPRPEAIDAARAARVRPAVHAAWKDATDGTRNWKRNWKRGVAMAAAAVLVSAVALTLVSSLRERGVPQAARLRVDRESHWIWRRHALSRLHRAARRPGPKRFPIDDLSDPVQTLIQRTKRPAKRRLKTFSFLSSDCG